MPNKLLLLIQHAPLISQHFRHRVLIILKLGLFLDYFEEAAAAELVEGFGGRCYDDDVVVGGRVFLFLLRRLLLIRTSSSRTAHLKPHLPPLPPHPPIHIHHLYIHTIHPLRQLPLPHTPLHTHHPLINSRLRVLFLHAHASLKHICGW